MVRKAKHNPERRRFFGTGAKVVGASGALLLNQQAAHADQSPPVTTSDEKPKGYQADSEQVKKYYQRARF